MSLRCVHFVASSCAIFAACLGSFIIGHEAGYLEALHEGYFRPAVVHEKTVDFSSSPSIHRVWSESPDDRRYHDDRAGQEDDGSGKAVLHD
jgi:hypothetical protein